MTPPESPRETQNNTDNVMAVDINHVEHKQRDQGRWLVITRVWWYEYIICFLGSKLSAQDLSLSLMQRNIKNEQNDSEH